MPDMTILELLAYMGIITLIPVSSLLNHFWYQNRKKGEGEVVVSKIEITTVPITNADRIRAMSDEELAEFLGRATGPCDYCQLARVMGACTEALCDDAMKNWLKQPAEGADNG